ncbi:MAG: NAD-dependent epimerase/dehydratase family protein [Bacteroidota bacterium]|nr:NAD-dependent epimerase/dehydratase family protein [Bacteroidota bacterium]
MIFLTGGTGLVGAHVLLKLMQNGQSVRALKRTQSKLSVVNRIFNYYNEEGLFKTIDWVDGDILDVLSIRDAMKGCKKVIHCAAIVSFDKSDYNQMMKNNIQGTANIVNTSLEVNILKLIHVSSIATLSSKTLPLEKTEESYFETSKNNTQYALSKYLAEQEVWRGIQEGLPSVIVNPSVILGPGNWSKGSSQLFEKVWDGLKFYTTGSTGYVDVLDVANIITTLMDSDILNQRFIINAENLKYKTVFDWISEELNRPKPHIRVSPLIKEIAWRLEKVKSIFTGKKPLITKETANKSMTNSSYSNQKICKALSYEFIPVRESVKNYSRWFLADRASS